MHDGIHEKFEAVCADYTKKFKVVVQKARMQKSEATITDFLLQYNDKVSENIVMQTH